MAELEAKAGVGCGSKERSRSSRLTGTFVLAMAVLANRALPLAHGHRLRSGLTLAALLLIPYTALWIVYLSGVGR